MRIPMFRLLPVLMVVLLGGCGGGGGSSSGGSASGDSATVGLLVTDAPVGRWDQAIATITSVQLIGGEGQVTLFSGSETLDLLKLGDFSELFAVSDDVPAGSYSKIRLRLSDLVLNDLDDEGNVLESIQPKLVGNGKIDLNPQGPFDLAPGDSVVIELDFDMEKSLKVTETGNGKLIIRPVIFVKIRTERPLDGRLTRIYGEVTEIDPANQEFQLCQTRDASHWDDDDNSDQRGSDSDSDDFTTDRRCVMVGTDADTGIFDADGLPQDFTGLEVGEKLTAIGRLVPVDDDDGGSDSGSDSGADSGSDPDSDSGDESASSSADSDDDGDSDDANHHRFALDSLIIEEGSLGTYQRIAGTVAGEVDLSLDQFALDVAPGQGISTDAPLPVQLFEKSRIFNRAGEELERSAINVDDLALVDGVLVIGADDLIRSPLVVLGDEGASEADSLQGEIVDVNVEDGTLLVNDGTGDRCVNAAAARIFEIEVGDDRFESERVELDDLEPGQKVVIFGTEGVGGCLDAGTILAEK